MDFDYVIVGAGSAGCVLANRLSASGKHKVLLLEAGGSDRRFWIQVPIGYGKTFFDARVNWMYQAEPDRGLAGRAEYWPRGKVLGGSSSINALVYIRGQAADYDAWEAAGNPGWGWRDVLPYFKRSESHAWGGDALHGAEGPLTVADVSADLHPICQAYLEAGRQVGLPVLRDLNGDSQDGVGLYQITAHRGRRMSAARAFLRPAMRRPNLAVITKALATRILFEGRRAVGVEYLRGGRRQQVRAGREVVLAAGAINSPQLLQLSGIGPAEQLQGLGIEVRLDAPQVGRNLQDHLGLDYVYRCTRPTLNDALHSWPGKLWAGANYLLLRRGPLRLSLNQGGGFCRSRPEVARPNLQLYFSPVSYTTAPSGTRPLMNPDGFPAFRLGISNCRPTSRGHLALQSTDPREPLAIHPNGLSTNHDLQELLEGVHLIRRMAATPALSALIDEEMTPGQSVEGDEALIDDIRQRSTTIFHPSGTCRMGPDAEAAVVDPRLSVHGLSGLRVIDTSVFPTIPSGNTNAPAIMLGEKGADLLLEDAV